MAVADGAPHDLPEFLVVRYFGRYRDGSAGRGDALYIVATAEAARKAWWSRSTILDFRELEYRWGDEMEWVAGIGWEPGIRLHWPLAIVVGDKCRDGLGSLLAQEYDHLCVETPDEPTTSAAARRKSLSSDSGKRKRAVGSSVVSLTLHA